jgi:PKD repeat protein
MTPSPSGTVLCAFALCLACGGDGGGASDGEESETTSGDGESTGEGESGTDTLDEESSSEGSAESTGESTGSEGTQSSPPVALIEADPSAGDAYLVVNLDGSASSDPDDDIVSWTWDFGDGANDEGEVVSHIYKEVGLHEVTLTVEDSEGQTDSAMVDIDVLMPSCPNFADPVIPGNLQASTAVEISGVVVSRDYEDVLWGQNDSGGGLRNVATAFRPTGEHLGDYELAGLQNRDWEDISMGPGPNPDRDHIYIAEIGDNNFAYATLWIHRLAEPELDLDNPPVDPVQVVDVESFEIRYPDGFHNAETLIVDPATEDVYIVTKQWNDDLTTRVYRAAAPLDDQVVAELELMLSQGEAPNLAAGYIGGDVSPLGDRVILKRYNMIQMWFRLGDVPLWEVFLDDPCTGPGAPGQQESVGLTPDRLSYYMVPEGAQPPIYFVEGL